MAEWLEKSSEWCVRNPAVRALMQLAGTVTFGATSAIDAALAQTVQNMREERARIFFEELDHGNIQLSADIIQSDDFLHAYFVTARAALNSRRSEKIQLFARMLKSLSANNTPVQSIDEYEEYLEVLDELSYREFIILGILDSYEQRHPIQPAETTLQRNGRYWHAFTTEVKDTLHLTDGELASVLTRLNRTGLYKEITGTYFDYEGGQGMLAETYHKLKSMICEIQN